MCSSWVYYWQTLIAGGLALLAGGGTVWGTLVAAKRQVRAANEAADREIKASREAADRQIAAAQEQTKAAQHQTEVMRQIEREVERAYVSGGGAFLVQRRFDPRTQIETLKRIDAFQLTVDNYGKTPADVSDVDIGFCTAPNFPVPPNYTLNRMLGMRVPPGKEGLHTPVQLRRRR